jgi:hypothetical protein
MASRLTRELRRGRRVSCLRRADFDALIEQSGITRDEPEPAPGEHLSGDST